MPSQGICGLCSGEGEMDTSKSHTPRAIAVGDLDFGAERNNRHEEQKAPRQLFLNVADFVFSHIDLCLYLMSFSFFLMATMLI